MKKNRQMKYTATPQAIPWKTIHAWYFDLDGTLMDTDDQAVESLAQRLRFLGAARAQRLARRLVMMGETPMNDFITVLDVVGLDAVLFAVRKLLSGPIQPTFRVVAGVQPLLEALSHHATLAVVTTRSQSAAAAFLKQHALESYFQLLVTQETTWRLKPHPQPLLYASEQLDVATEQCVMVGDTPVDILAARRAGAWAVGVLCGFGEEDELWRSGAHIVLPSTADLLQIISQN